MASVALQRTDLRKKVPGKVTVDQEVEALGALWPCWPSPRKQSSCRHPWQWAMGPPAYLI